MKTDRQQRWRQTDSSYLERNMRRNTLRDDCREWKALRTVRRTHKHEWSDGSSDTCTALHCSDLYKCYYVTHTSTHTHPSHYHCAAIKFNHAALTSCYLISSCAWQSWISFSSVRSRCLPGREEKQGQEEERGLSAIKMSIRQRDVQNAFDQFLLIWLQLNSILCCSMLFHSHLRGVLNQ